MMHGCDVLLLPAGAMIRAAGINQAYKYVCGITRDSLLTYAGHCCCCCCTHPQVYEASPEAGAVLHNHGHFSFLISALDPTATEVRATHIQMIKAIGQYSGCSTFGSTHVYAGIFAPGCLRARLCVHLRLPCLGGGDGEFGGGGGIQCFGTLQSIVIMPLAASSPCRDCQCAFCDRAWRGTAGTAGSWWCPS